MPQANCHSERSEESAVAESHECAGLSLSSKFQIFTISFTPEGNFPEQEPFLSIRRDELACLWDLIRK